MNNNAITILKIANGWLVIIPQVQQFLPGGFTKDQFVEMGQAIAQGQGAIDPVLSQLQEQKREELAIYANDNEHCFKTFAEVIAFLDFKFGEGK